MAEIITEDKPRIKYSLTRTGGFTVPYAHASPALRALCALMGRMEAAGAAPVLNDGKVGGNCAISEHLAIEEQAGAGHDSGVLVSRSGKVPGAALAPGDFARVTSFDRAVWAASFESRSEEVLPSSDSPLLWAVLRPDAAAAYGWEQAPRVVLHGHALESGAGLAAAQAHGIPVSQRETLFSTPEDLAELEALLRSHPYPAHTTYIRRGHGFFVLGNTVADAEAAFQRVLSIMAVARAAAA